MAETKPWSAPLSNSEMPESQAVLSEIPKLASGHDGINELQTGPGAIDSSDPYHWPQSKKLINLALVAFHAFMATFIASSILSALADIADDLHTTPERCSYLISIVIAALGVAPLAWAPLAQKYGHRPVFLLTLACTAAGNVGCAVSPSYPTMAVCRALAGCFICPAASIGSGVVTAMFPPGQRARYMGVWTSMVTLGIPMGPLIFGFVAVRVSYRWIYWILAITNAVQFLLSLFLGSETRYIGTAAWSKHRFILSRVLALGPVDQRPLRVVEFLRPLAFAFRPCVMIPACAYSMVFLFGSILTTIETSVLFQELFDFNPQQVGLQFIALIIGTAIGEQMGGFMSDKWMEYGLATSSQQQGQQLAPAHDADGVSTRQAEHRLWISWIGYLLAIAGVVVYCVQLDKARTWNVTPLVGAAIAAAGNQVVTSVLTTYAVDSYPNDAASIGVFIVLVRQIWGFIGPFWFPPLISKAGLRGSAAVFTAMIIGVSMLPTVLLQWRGSRWRK